MSSSRIAQNPNRQTRKGRQDATTWNRRGKPNDRFRVDHEKYSRSDYDLSTKDSKDDLTDKSKDKDKDRKKKETNQIKPTRLAKSPRRVNKDQINSNNDKRMTNQRRDIKIKNDSKDKLKEKKSSDSLDRHPLFQDNSRLSQLIAQITSLQEDPGRRVTASQSLLEYIYDAANLEAVKRNCSNIFSALEEILKERGHNELKDNIIHCYASIGHILGIDCDKFFQWVFSKIPSAANDQLRVLYLRTISESVQLDVGKQIFYDTMPLIMASLQDVLENADSPDLLLVILDVLSIIARDYPHIFAEYFRDTVDILVGWHIDTTQTKQLTDKTAVSLSECLVSFQVYWVSDMRFSLTLLGQFLEDMEAYAEELSSINLGEFSVEDMPSPFVSLPKLTALTRVFTTVAAGLGEFFSPGREAKITTTYIVDTVNRILKCVDICSYDLKFEPILVAANNCLRVLVGSLGHSISVSCLHIITFVNNQLDNKKQASYKLHLSALLLIEKLITVVSQALPAEVVSELIGENKPLLNIRCFVDEELLGLVLKIFQLLLGIKNIPLLETVYKLFVEDITKAYNILLKSTHCEMKALLVKHDDKQELEEKTELVIDEVAVKDAYKTLVFDLSALAEIAVFKSSITGAWKVYPSTFTLLSSIINPSEKVLMNKYPELQYSILNTLLCHSQRCNNFIPSAKTKTQPNSVESTALLELLCGLLQNPNTTAQVKSLCAVWFGDIISSISALPMDTQKRQWNLNPVMETLICLLYDAEPSVQTQAANAVTRITRTGLIHPVFLAKLLAECLPHLTSLDKEVFNSFWLMTVSFPADLLASLPTVNMQLSKMKYIGSSSSTQATCKKDMWRLCKIHMCRNPTGNLHAYAFRLVMKTLLCGAESNIEEKFWMSKQFSICQRIGKTCDPVCGEFTTARRIEQSHDYVFPTNLSNMDTLLWFYFTWATAEYCVVSKLKTPLGKASDTFQTIEGAIRELRNNFKEKDTSVKPPLRIKKKHVNEEEMNFTPEPSRTSMLHQAVLILQFLENLEKFMYNAYEGTTTSLPQLIRPVRTFFRTNRSTCLEWLHRIQENVTVLANLCGCPEKAVRSGYIWLQHLQKTNNTQGAEFERAIVTVVDALMQLHCYESIQGLLEWSRKVVGRNFFWLYASSIKAKGSLESAADQFKAGLVNYLSPDRSKTENINEVKKPAVTVLTKDPVINAEPMSIEFLVDQVTDCYLQLCDWNEVQEWNKKVNELHKKFPSVHGLKSTVDHSYVKAMMKFDEHDFPGVHEQLELLPGATMSNILQEQFPVLGSAKEDKDLKTNKQTNMQDNMSLFSHNSTPKAMLCQSRVYLMQALTLYWTSGLNTLKGSRVGSLHSSAWEAVDDLLNRAVDSSFAPVHAMLRNQSSKSLVPFLMQLKSISAIRETLMVTDTSQDGNSIFINVYGRSQYINPNKTDISILNEALRTASYLQYHHSLHKKGWVGPATYSTDKLPNVQTLQVMTAKLARKQGNKKLAESLLAKQLSLLESKGALDGKMYLTGGAQLKLKQLSASVSSGKVVDPLAAVDILKESAKLKRTLGNISEAVDVLCSSILLSERQIGISANKLHNNYSKLSEVSARSFVTLAKWILTEPRLLSPIGDAEEAVTVGPKVREVIKAINKSSSSNSKFSQNTAFGNLMSEGVFVCGQLLHHSTHRCPSLGKTWFCYADWCYKWGRKIVEQESFSNQIELIEEEKASVVDILPKGTSVNVIETIYGVLTKAHCLRNKFEENDLSTSAVLEEVSLENEQEKLKFNLIHAVEEELTLSKEALLALMNIWKSVMERLFCHYKQAATAYLTYLKISGNETLSYDDFSKRSDYGNITATLRLLRLLVKYSGELKEHMEIPFSQTPTKPWRSIIPQLFARLNHPEPYVQSSVANLLCRIARDSPQLIVYPTVVGCTDMMPQQQLSKTSAAGILRAYQYAADDEFEQQPDISPDEIEVGSQVDDTEGEESQDEPPSISVEEKQVLSALHTIVDTLTEDNPVLIQEVKCVIQELRRITLLWDELWLGSLTQLHQEAQRRMQQLQSEINRVNTNRTLTESQKMLLIKEKHSALMKPLIYALERLQKITSQQPETPHEQAFQKQFGNQILDAIDSLKMPVDPSKPDISWSGAKQLYQTLQVRAQKRSLNNLIMSEASPILAQKKFNLIPLPGLDRNGDEAVSLNVFCNDIQVLPTKTKPKKLVMIGSDGQRYPYLFKGLEDLHLDERIMQFLEICNHMFAKEDKSGERKYFARHYSVTPLGPRSGLIQWVDGATPLFTLYRRWQQREAAAQAILKTQGDKNLPITIQPPSRPTELFFNKVNPLLQEKGIEHNSSRKDWPMSILKKVLHELSEDTPNYLLSQELWCSSINAADWWNITQSYSRSVAVMSMIGYVIGLGDRHLDNILVDLTTGEVVHIDYNVCFEKGKALRVPEKVPFRLTRNMQNALGVTGVEGIFRSSCESVMSSLRHGREILLTLLEAFVYDPLIDWTTANDAAFAGAFYGGGGGGLDGGNRFSRKEMERGITQTLLSTRVAEMKVAWSANKEELLTSLDKLKQYFESYCTALNNQKFANDELVQFQQQVSILKAALVKPDHPLHTLQSRYDKQAKLLENLKYWKQKMEDKLFEIDQMQKQFKTAFLSFQGNRIANLYNEVCKLADIGPPSFSAAATFLNNAGQSNIVSQCEHLESELTSILNQRRGALRACLDSLLSYSGIVSQFSLEYIVHHSFTEWIPLFSYILEEPTVSKCKQVLNDHGIISKRKSTILKDAETMSLVLEGKLHQYFNEQNSKLVKLHERRSSEQVETMLLSGPVTETWNALRRFIGEAGSPGATSLACVTVTALATLNKRQLFMENAAAGAGQRLMNLTSREGDWFLDELATMCSNISQLLSVLKNNPLRSTTQKGNTSGDVMENISYGMQVVFAGVKAYTSLQELMTNFRTIIVPEAVKWFLNYDTSVFQITEKIRTIIDSLQYNPQALCEHYQKALKEKSSVADEITNIIDNLKCRFEQLSEPKDESLNNENEEGTVNSVPMSAGQMLLAGFSGLFNKVEVELSALYEANRKMKSPDGFDHIDLQQEQRNMKASKIICNSLNSKWSNFLFLKKLIVIHGFFDSAIQQTYATREIDNATRLLNATSSEEINISQNNERSLRVFNEELLCLPVKQFIAECVQNFIIGIPSQALTNVGLYYVGLLASNVARDARDGRKGLVTMEDICKKVVDYSLKSGAFPHQHLSQASSLINAHDTAWRKHDLARRLDSSIAAQKEAVHRAQLQLARFQWFYEEFLSNSKLKKSLANPSKVSIINEIKKRLQAVSQIEHHGLPTLMERNVQLQSSIEQRLKWASGANPALNTVLKKFDQAVNERKSYLLEESKLTREIINIAGSIVKMESFKLNVNEKTSFEQTAVSIVQKCEESCNAFESCMGDLGDVELLMHRLQIPIPPKEAITIDWMKSRLDLLDKKVNDLYGKESTLKNAIVTERESLKSQISSIKGTFTSHHSLVGEVKNMLKALAKDEEAEECLNVRQFIQAQNLFSEDSSIILKKILTLSSSSRSESEEVSKLTEEDSFTTVKMMDDLVNNVVFLHDQLLLFGSTSLQQTEVSIPNVNEEQESFASALLKVNDGIVQTNDSLFQESQGDGGGGKARVENLPFHLPLNPQPPGVLSPTNSNGKLNAISPRKKTPLQNRDPKTGKALQEKNLYALNVWKRVKSKLEGRDLDPTRRVAVSEQVAQVIDEAVSIENLSQLYEGWTPWV